MTRPHPLSEIRIDCQRQILELLDVLQSLRRLYSVPLLNIGRGLEEGKKKKWNFLLKPLYRTARSWLYKGATAWQAQKTCRDVCRSQWHSLYSGGRIVGGDNGDGEDDGILNVFGGENILRCGCFLVWK